MARAGRKRKAGPRQPNGQPRRAPRSEARDIGTPETARRVKLMLGKGTSAETSDRMCAAGLITDHQNEAAALFRWFREKAYGKPRPKIGGYSEMISEGTLKPIADIGEGEDKQARALKAYMAGVTAVQQRLPGYAGVELQRVVIDNATPDRQTLKALCNALDVLHGVYFMGLALDDKPR